MNTDVTVIMAAVTTVITTPLLRVLRLKTV